MASTKTRGERESIIEASITNSNNNWETLILQQSLKRFLKSKCKVWIQLNILTSFLDKKQLVSIKQFSSNIFFFFCLISNFLATYITHSIPVLLEQQEAVLYPSHMNQALEQALLHPWKRQDLRLFHERIL